MYNVVELEEDAGVAVLDICLPRDLRFIASYVRITTCNGVKKGE